MNIDNLSPFGAQALEFPHFPTRQQAVVWRNWTLVPVARLAQVLETDEKNVLALAEGMGLSVPPIVNPQWMVRGYITIIRNNWHLLPYEQLLALLGWDADKLAYTLKEDDFLGHKLREKPVAEPVRYRPLTADETRKTAELKATVNRYFPDLAGEDPMKPFEFLKAFETVPAGLKKADPNGPLRLVYSYSAVYGDPLLEPELDPYPEGLLARLADTGVNAVWLQGVLYTLVPFPFEPELSKGWETRIANLRALCRKAAKYGIGVYLYLNEPRGMTLDFYARHPEIKGADHRNPEANVAAMCSSTPEVIRYLREAPERLFREASELGGVFTISMSENLTNCWSGANGETCPRCSKRPPEEVVAEVNRTIAEGVHAAKPSARVIVWTWAWPENWAEKAIDLLPSDIALMCVSEWGVATEAMGVKGVVTDYSVSKVGPGPYAEKLWARAQKRGLKTIAKVQLNNSWECSATPYIPSPGLVERHIGNLKKRGVFDLMAGWTLGGWPGGNLELLSSAKEDLAREKFGERAAPLVLKAWAAIDAAFPNFPQNRTAQLYVAPQNYGPMSLFYDKPTGYRASMIGYPYDDIYGWTGGGHFPEDVFEEQFRKLAEGWKIGLSFLAEAETLVPPDKRAEYEELRNVADACYRHFRSVYNQIVFVRNRAAETSEQRQKALAAIADEIEQTLALYAIVRKDSRIGFEASNHYYYTLNDLREKILNLERLKAL